MQHFRAAEVSTELLLVTAVNQAEKKEKQAVRIEHEVKEVNEEQQELLDKIGKMRGEMAEELRKQHPHGVVPREGLHSQHPHGVVPRERLHSQHPDVLNRGRAFF